MARFLILLIRIYQIIISPVFPPACRFHPTCSNYAIESLRRYGFLCGTMLMLRRILKCHPWHPGGYDPVP